MTAGSVVFAKEKPSNILEHKTSSRFKFTLRGGKEVYFSFSRGQTFTRPISPRLGQNNTCVFHDRDDFTSIIILFSTPFSE